jgi:hypothetical protein
VKVDEIVTLCSTFYAIDALATSIVPSQISQPKLNDYQYRQDTTNQINKMATDSFLLYCFHAFTGLKVILICNITNKDGPNCLKNIYEVYSDFVQKDPAYTVYSLLLLFFS